MSALSLLYIESVASLYREPLSLDQQLPSDDGDARTLGDDLADPRPLPDAQIDQANARPLVARALRGIDRQSALVIALRYLAGWSPREAGEVLGLGPSRVAQIERQAVSRMREGLSARGHR